MPKIVLDDLKSLFDPLEVEFEGKTYQVREPTLIEWEEIEALDEKVKSGEIKIWNAIRLQLGYFLDDKDFIGKLNRHMAARLLQAITDLVIRDTAKNAERLAEEKLPS